MRAEISQAGVFTSGAMDRLGGFDALVRAFAQPTSRALLDSFRGPARPPASAAEDSGVGVYLRRLQRRFISASEVQEATGGDPSNVRKLLDGWVRRGILYRGIVLKCMTCRFDGWYRAGEFSQTFVCTRCRSVWPLSGEAWRQPLDEPTWRYELDEIVYQAVIENARAPILALHALRSGSRFGFLFSPELDVYESGSGDPFTELDIWAVVDGRICVGEAKTVDRLANKDEPRVIQRLVRAAEAATADELVIATTEPALRSATRAQLEVALRGRRPRLRILEGAALDAAAQKLGPTG